MFTIDFISAHNLCVGVFFQWVLCVGIWLVGLVVNFILDSPVFFLPTVIGGFLWTTGTWCKSGRGWCTVWCVVCREHVGGAHHQDGWNDDGIDCVGSHQHAEWLGGRKVCAVCS